MGNAIHQYLPVEVVPLAAAVPLVPAKRMLGIAVPATVSGSVPNAAFPAPHAIVSPTFSQVAAAAPAGFLLHRNVERNASLTKADLSWRH
jgi:hypothetical protein